MDSENRVRRESRLPNLASCAGPYRHLTNAAPMPSAVAALSVVPYHHVWRVLDGVPGAHPDLRSAPSPMILRRPFRMRIAESLRSRGDRS